MDKDGSYVGWKQKRWSYLRSYQNYWFVRDMFGSLWIWTLSSEVANMSLPVNCGLRHKESTLLAARTRKYTHTRCVPFQDYLSEITINEIRGSCKSENAIMHAGITAGVCAARRTKTSQFSPQILKSSCYVHGILCGGRPWEVELSSLQPLELRSWVKYMFKVASTIATLCIRTCLGRFLGTWCKNPSSCLRH